MPSDRALSNIGGKHSRAESMLPNKPRRNLSEGSKCCHNDGINKVTLIVNGMFCTARESVSIQNSVSNCNKALGCQTWDHISRNDVSPVKYLMDLVSVMLGGQE